MHGDPTTEPRAPADGTGGKSPQVPALHEVLLRLRDVLTAATYPLLLPSADEARRTRAALVAQLDDHLLPRLARLDAPLLAVVGGSTGAGKSTLVNSLVRTRVSASGVLRPTTRAPVLVCHPRDTVWFRRDDLLPGLIRTSRPSTDPHTLQLVSAPALAPGLALLDAPDIDSVVEANHALATQLFAAADLWLFVTTATRYADAAPWGLLRTARLRGTVIALVLNRVPDAARDEVAAHLSELLAGHDLAAVPLFVVPETKVDGQGLLPESAIAHLRDWLNRIAADPRIRAGVIRQTIDGAVAALGPAVIGLADAADEQAAAARLLDERVRAAYRIAGDMVADGLRNGHLLHGEVRARWQEFLDTGELFRDLEARGGRLRGRFTGARSGRQRTGSGQQDAGTDQAGAGPLLATAIESQLVALLCGVAADAAETAYANWQSHPAGAALLTPDLARPAPDLAERAGRLVREWQHGVWELVRAEGRSKRFAARGAAVTAAGLAVMITMFAATALPPTEVGSPAGTGTSHTAQQVLEAVFGDQAARRLVDQARTDLHNRVGTLLVQEAKRHLGRITTAGGTATTELGRRLRRLAAEVEQARTTGLTGNVGSARPEIGR